MSKDLEIVYIQNPPLYTNHFQVGVNTDGVMLEFRAITPAVKGEIKEGQELPLIDPMGFLPHSRIFLTANGAEKLGRLILSTVEEMKKDFAGVADAGE